MLFLVGCGTPETGVKIESITINVTGDEFDWHFRYPGPDGVLGTRDDRHSIQNLYLPENAHITLNLTSKDYVYFLELPILGLKEMAVPGMDFGLKFKTSTAGEWELLGDQFCGYSHETLIGTVYIRSQMLRDFYAWDDANQ